jgi:hypothetical protein
MRAYGELRALGPITVGGLPAGLLARDATPLTSLCQFTELLAKDRVENEEDRPMVIVEH